jgi:hypothetical protein
MENAGNDGVEWARQIQELGWQQCSVFRPPLGAEAGLPDYLALVPGEWLLVCTQSCSVCSRNFQSEPLVEVCAASPVARFSHNHAEARGKVGHAFHLPIGGLPGAEALRCHLGRRAFIPRRLLLGWQPEKTWLKVDALNAFKGWLANHYMRIALPDILMNRLHGKDGIRQLVGAVLERDMGDGRRVEDLVNAFYIEAEPDEDLPPARLYCIRLMVVCQDEDARELLDRELGFLQGTPSSPLSINGVIVSELLVTTKDDATLAKLEGKSRFNDWDHLSPLPEQLKGLQTAV